jgi:hypothetical protein
MGYPDVVGGCADEEYDMHEVFPIVAGALAGLAVLRIESIRLRTFALIVLSVLLGVVATIISGEALISWAFVLIDIPLVFCSGLAAIGAVVFWQRRQHVQLQ